MNLRKFIDKVITYIINKLSHYPDKKWSKKIIKLLKKSRNKFFPNLFDDETFLLYVKRKKLAFENKLSAIEVLALRGSTADYGFYSPAWENSFNLGLTSSDLNISFFLYERYRKSLLSLNTVVIYFNVPSVGYSIIRTIERYRAVPYKHFFNIPYSASGFINKKFEKKILKKCKRLEAGNIDKDFSGYEKKTYFGVDIPVKIRAQKHLRENKREPNQLIWLKKLADLVNKDKRELVVVFQPFRSDYKKLLPGSSELFEKVLKIEGIRFLNFYDSELFDDSDFGDADHLNEKGAIKLTNEIKKQLKNKTMN